MGVLQEKWFYQLSWQCKLATARKEIRKADVSSVSPSLERIKELWVVCVIQKDFATLLVGAW